MGLLTRLFVGFQPPHLFGLRWKQPSSCFSLAAAAALSRLTMDREALLSRPARTLSSRDH